MKDYRDVIIRPVVTEQTMKDLEENNKVTFKVDKRTNKIEVRQAVENLFGVKVKKVNILNTKAKKKRVGRYTGKVGGFKKAVVTLEEGESIPLFAETEQE